MSAQGSLWEMDGPIAVAERPHARAEAFGMSALSDSELLALMLGGQPTKALALARGIIAEAGSLAGIASLCGSGRVSALGKTKGAQLQAVLEIARRIATQEARTGLPMTRPELVAEAFRVEALTLEVEKFWVLCLDRKNKLTRRVEVTSGTATSALAHPREVFRAAVRESAAAIICVHNHPSGDPAPSAADTQVTRLLREAAKAVDIPLQDHVIVGRAAADPAGRGFFSYREAGML